MEHLRRVGITLASSDPRENPVSDTLHTASTISGASIFTVGSGMAQKNNNISHKMTIKEGKYIYNNGLQKISGRHIL